MIRIDCATYLSGDFLLESVDFSQKRENIWSDTVRLLVVDLIEKAPVR